MLSTGANVMGLADFAKDTFIHMQMMRAQNQITKMASDEAAQIELDAKLNKKSNDIMMQNVV